MHKGNIAVVGLVIGALALLGVVGSAFKKPIILFGSGGEEIPTAVNSGDQDFTVGGRLIVNGTATSTFSGGLDVLTVGGIETQSGIVVSGGSLLASGIGATLGSTSVAGLTSSGGYTLTGGCFKDPSGTCVKGTVLGSGTNTRVPFWSAADTLSSNANFTWADTPERLTITLASTTASLSIGNLLNVDGTGTSTFTGGLSLPRLSATAASSTVSIATSTPSNISSLEVRGDIFFKGQSYSEWVPLTVAAPSTIFDCAEGNRFSGTANIAIVILEPKNCKSGQVAIIRIVQDATGGRIVNFASSSMLNSQYAASTTANSIGWYGVVFFGSKGTVLSATSTSPNPAN